MYKELPGALAPLTHIINSNQTKTLTAFQCKSLNLKCNYAWGPWLTQVSVLALIISILTLTFKMFLPS